MVLTEDMRLLGQRQKILSSWQSKQHDHDVMSAPFASQPPSSTGTMQVGLDRHLYTHWVEIQEGNNLMLL